MLGGTDAQQRAVASLQQQLTVLKADVARLRAEQIATEVLDVEALAARSAPDRSGMDRPRAPLAKRVPAVTTTPHMQGSPGGRILLKSLGTLSSRLRYAD